MLSEYKVSDEQFTAALKRKHSCDFLSYGKWRMLCTALEERLAASQNRAMRVCSGCGCLVVGALDHPCDKCDSLEGELVEVVWWKLKAERDKLQDEIGEWQTATLLGDSGGDPSGITPDILERETVAIRAECDKLKADNEKLHGAIKKVLSAFPLGADIPDGDIVKFNIPGYIIEDLRAVAKAAHFPNHSKCKETDDETSME